MGGAFKNCKQLKTVIFPEAFGYIERDSFYGCTAIENLYLPAGVIVGARAFQGVTSKIYVGDTQEIVAELWASDWNAYGTTELEYSASRPTVSGTDEE
jgi:hypothetical protein